MHYKSSFIYLYNTIRSEVMQAMSQTVHKKLKESKGEGEGGDQKHNVLNCEKLKGSIFMEVKAEG